MPDSRISDFLGPEAIHTDPVTTTYYKNSDNTADKAEGQDICNIQKL